MDFQTVINLVGTGLLFWAALVGVASVVVHARVDWRATAMGRHLMGYMAALASVLVLSCIRILTGDSWWFQLLRLVAFIGIPVFMTQRLVLQLRAQRTPRSSEDKDPHP